MKPTAIKSAINTSLIAPLKINICTEISSLKYTKKNYFWQLSDHFKHTSLESILISIGLLQRLFKIKNKQEEEEAKGDLEIAIDFTQDTSNNS